MIEHANDNAPRACQVCGDPMVEDVGNNFSRWECWKPGCPASVICDDCGLKRSPSLSAELGPCCECPGCDHAGAELMIDRATGEETCAECGAPIESEFASCRVNR